MTAEELLRPRYKVIADYPGNTFDVGTVLYKMNKTHGWLSPCNNINIGMHIEAAKKYPHLFEPIPWYADRKPEDMPEYVKGARSVKKLLQTECHSDKYPSLLFEGETIWAPAWMYQPATKEEYDSFINSKS